MRPDTTECEACGELMPCCALVPYGLGSPHGDVSACHRCRSIPDDACDDCIDYNAPPWWMAWWWVGLVALAVLLLLFVIDARAHDDPESYRLRCVYPSGLEVRCNYGCRLREREAFERGCEQTGGEVAPPIWRE